MQTIILAGGWGTRLGRLTGTMPKPMVTVGGKPILWHIMKTYSAFGFNDFIIALGVKADVIKKYFYNYEIENSDFSIELGSKKVTFHNHHLENNWKVTLLDTGLDTLKGGRIKRTASFIKTKTNFLTYGDGLCDIDLNELLQFHKSHGKMVTITGVQPPARFGEIKEKKGEVLSFEEKPQASDGLINGGYMVFNNELLDHLTEDKNCDFEYGALENLSSKGEVMVYKNEGNWACMDTERDVVYLNNLWNKDKAFWKKW